MEEIKQEQEQIPTIVHSIKCHFCGNETGQIEIQTDMPQEQITNEMFGIADTRCSDCESAHGNFKEMAETYSRETGNTYDQFKIDIEKAEWKKSNLEGRIKEIKDSQQKQKNDGQLTD